MIPFPLFEEKTEHDRPRSRRPCITSTRTIWSIRRRGRSSARSPPACSRPAACCSCTATAPGLLIVAVVFVLGVMAVWWRDVIREAIVGHHTKVVQLGLRYGMLSVHRLRGDVLLRLLLGVLFIEPVSGRRPLAAQGHPALQPVRPAVPQHADPAVLGHHRDLGASRAARRQPQGADPGPAWSR